MPGPTLAEARAALDAFDWDKWRDELEDAFAEDYTAIAISVGARTALRLGGTWKDDNPFVVKFARKYIAERVTQISETTRDRLRDTIASVFEDARDGGDPVTVPGIRSAIQDAFTEFSTQRAQLIARTETAIALNHGQLFGYLASGYSYVVVSDGDDFDEECAAADGQIWSIEYALSNPIEHPNCERSFTEISDEDAEQEGIDED